MRTRAAVFILVPLLLLILAVAVHSFLRPAADRQPAAAATPPPAARTGPAANSPPASQVRYTEARLHPVRRVVQLPGSAQPILASVVASEVAGLVAEMPGRDGRRVGKGDTLVRLRQTSLELRLGAAQAEREEAEARAALAGRELERSRQLFEDGILSQSQLDVTRFELDAQRGRVARLTAEIERLRDDLDRSVVRAPFDGVVVREHTEIGQWIVQGGPVVELHGVGELEVLVDVPERHYADLRPGARVRVTVDVLPGVEIEGRVTSIVPSASPQTRTFPVRVRMANPGGRIGAGMLAQVALPVGAPYDAVLVPKDAVVIQGTERLVYVLTDEGTAARVTVTTGAGVGDWIAVDGPLQAGSRVITRGNERLRPGQPVAGTPLEYATP